MPIVEVKDLCVALERDGAPVIEDVSFVIDPGEIVGLAGETGSGKTTIANALAGHARRGARFVRGSIVVDGRELMTLPEPELDAVRGSVVAFVPQDPSASLNPSLRIGAQMREMFEYHEPRIPRQEQVLALAATLKEVGLPASQEFLRRYPHQLSGGQEQRVLLAMAFLRRPRLVVMDEPTTGLDVGVQARILTMVRQLCRAHGSAVLYVTHDLAVLNELADRVMIAYAGRVVEIGPRQTVFADPAHPYTRQLLAAIPDIAIRMPLRPIPGQAPGVQDRPKHCGFAPRCSLAIDRCRTEQPVLSPASQGQVASCFRLADARTSTIAARRALEPPAVADRPALLAADRLQASYGGRVVLADVSLSMATGEIVALVGESGSGKTTLARVIMGVVQPDGGSVSYDGAGLTSDLRRRPEKVRRELQYVYQSPFRSLNPRRTIGNSIRTPLELFGQARGQALTDRVAEALDRVALPRSYINRYPDQLSGGERQRVAIARAVVCNPRVLICDEVTSALDVSVQAAIVDLLEELRRDTRLAILFITHNLALVRSIADRVVVLNIGRIEEEGPAETVLTHPEGTYTQALIVNTPSIRARRRADARRPGSPPSTCGAIDANSVLGGKEE